jgi:hypothetical protein
VALHPTPPHVATPPRTLPSILGSTSGMGDYRRQKGAQDKIQRRRRPSLELMATPPVHPGSKHHPAPFEGRNPWRGMTEAVHHHPTIDLVSPPTRRVTTK